MGVSERKQRHRASLRRDILDAASQLFVEEGYERLTMRRVAERIEYSPTTIYLHFKDKGELLQAVCEETFAELAGKLERLQRAANTPIAHLREVLRTYIDFGTAHPNQYSVTFLIRKSGEEMAEFEQSAGSRAFDALRQGVRACVDSGDIRTADVDRTAQALWAGVHGLTSLFITMPGFPYVSRTALIDHTIDILIAGLKTPALRPPPPRQTRSAFLD